ncbi:hypothetical protein MSAN_01498200 [Mycena sanguinolenta]|uniref:Uncharacterized protein n=1 Tax=Mycena sanguinolenta TaxID=230812 RepID=A0A8H7CWI0_9AGAR|nr:hypothetical protein MSAN_01498200 [Mycena sanguinolenta]
MTHSSDPGEPFRLLATYRPANAPRRRRNTTLSNHHASTTTTHHSASPCRRERESGTHLVSDVLARQLVFGLFRRLPHCHFSYPNFTTASAPQRESDSEPRSISSTTMTMAPPDRAPLDEPRATSD